MSNNPIQSELDQFVSHNVITNANEMIQCLNENEIMQDEIMEISVSFDYLQPALHLIDNEMSEVDRADFEVGYGMEDCRSWVKDDGNAQDICTHFNLEPYLVEALEYWIVSDWLGEKLQEHGEMVADDLLGFTIWGRTCSGQSISMDHVISEIYKG